MIASEKGVTLATALLDGKTLAIGYGLDSESAAKNLLDQLDLLTSLLQKPLNSGDKSSGG